MPHLTSILSGRTIDGMNRVQPDHDPNPAPDGGSPISFLAEIEATAMMVQSRVSDACVHEYKQLEEAAGVVLGGVVCRIRETRNKMRR
jgi:hypothetical protein